MIQIKCENEECRHCRRFSSQKPPYEGRKNETSKISLSKDTDVITRIQIKIIIFKSKDLKLAS